MHINAKPAFKLVNIWQPSKENMISYNILFDICGEECLCGKELVSLHSTTAWNTENTEVRVQFSTAEL